MLGAIRINSSFTIFVKCGLFILEIIKFVRIFVLKLMPLLFSNFIKSSNLSKIDGNNSLFHKHNISIGKYGKSKTWKIESATNVSFKSQLERSILL